MDNSITICNDTTSKLLTEKFKLKLSDTLKKSKKTTLITPLDFL